MSCSAARRPRTGNHPAAVAVAGLLALLVAACTRTDRPSAERDGRAESTTTAVERAPVPGWKNILDEDFDRAGLDTRTWNTCHWWGPGGCTIGSNDEEQWYLPSQVSVVDGRLELTAQRRQVEGDGRRFEFVSGMVTTGPPTDEAPAKFDFTYGWVRARVRVPSGTGLWPALWMLPSSTDSRPEIDIVEVIGSDPDELILHLHPKDRDRPSEGHRVRRPGFSAGWHDVAIRWEPRSLTWYADGDEVWQVTGDDVPDEPMYLVANLAVGGVYPGPPDATSEFPATFGIDRVQVWQPPT